MTAITIRSKMVEIKGARLKRLSCHNAWNSFGSSGRFVLQEGARGALPRKGGAFHPPPNCLRQSGPALRTLALANSRSCQPEENDSGKIICLFLKILLDNARLLRYNSQRSRGQNAANLSDHGPVAQLVRAPACHAGGRRFEPDPGRHLLL